MHAAGNSYGCQSCIHQCYSVNCRSVEKVTLAHQRIKHEWYTPGMPKKAKSKKTVSQLKKEADAIFSKYIRTLYSNFGLVSCVTCGVEKPISEMQNGHYISRGYNYLRFDERNCHPQCVGCNVFRKGNYPAYARYLVRRYGAEILEELHEESKYLKQWRGWELEQIIEETKEKLKKLETQETILSS